MGLEHLSIEVRVVTTTIYKEGTCERRRSVVPSPILAERLPPHRKYFVATFPQKSPCERFFHPDILRESHFARNEKSSEQRRAIRQRSGHGVNACGRVWRRKDTRPESGNHVHRNDHPGVRARRDID